MSTLPAWTKEIIETYESGASSCFLLYGNIHDRTLLPQQPALDGHGKLGNLTDLILGTLLQRFDVVLTYDLGFGLHVARGNETFAEWPSFKGNPQLPKEPVRSAHFLSHYLKYCRNLKTLGLKAPKVAIIYKQLHLSCPALPHAHNKEINALATILQNWAFDEQLKENNQTVFLLSDNVNGVHPLISRCPRICNVDIPLPDTTTIQASLKTLAESKPRALPDNSDTTLSSIADRLTGATLTSIEDLILKLEYAKKPIDDGQLATLKKQLIERDCGGLIEFVEPDKNLDNCIGLDGVKQWLRQDIELWKKNVTDALPMGYLFCGPVGTGKTFLAECLAGEANIPVLTLKNFRDKWLGSTESNLEKIFALIHALGRCIVFIDEADQALGKRQVSSTDSGVSGRVYSMIAKEMSNTDNRGKTLWVLASSRPDLIEIDLKRPGRIDTKIPLFPTVNPEETFKLLRALCRRQGVPVEKSALDTLKPILPELLTPGAAEAIAVKAYRLYKTSQPVALQAISECLKDYLPPVPRATLLFQMQIAADEATDASLLPSEIKAILDAPNQ